MTVELNIACHSVTEDKLKAHGFFQQTSAEETDSIAEGSKSGRAQELILNQNDGSYNGQIQIISEL